MSRGPGRHRALQVARKFLVHTESSWFWCCPSEMQGNGCRSFLQSPCNAQELLSLGRQLGFGWSRFRRRQCKNSGQHLRWSFWWRVINVDTITKLCVSKEKFGLFR